MIRAGLRSTTQLRGRTTNPEESLGRLTVLIVRLRCRFPQVRSSSPRVRSSRPWTACPAAATNELQADQVQELHCPVDVADGRGDRAGVLEVFAGLSAPLDLSVIDLVAGGDVAHRLESDLRPTQQTGGHRGGDLLVPGQSVDRGDPERRSTPTIQRAPLGALGLALHRPARPPGACVTCVPFATAWHGMPKNRTPRPAGHPASALRHKTTVPLPGLPGALEHHVGVGPRAIQNRD